MSSDNQKKRENSVMFIERLSFSVIRWIVIILVIIAIIGIIMLIKSSLTVKEPTYVSYDEVEAQLSIQQDQDEPQYSSQAILIELPELIKEHFPKESENREVLEGWLGNLSKEEQKIFIDNMKNVINKAEQAGDDVTVSINKYKELWFSKYSSQGIFSDYAEEGKRFAYIAGVFSLLFIMVLLVLVLVLLAIERNTRLNAKGRED